MREIKKVLKWTAVAFVVMVVLGLMLPKSNDTGRENRQEQKEIKQALIDVYTKGGGFYFAPTDKLYDKADVAKIVATCQPFVGTPAFAALPERHRALCSKAIAASKH